MEILIKKLDELKKLLSPTNQENLTDELLDELYSVYPFNKFEYVISHLLANNVLSISDYYNIRSSYVERNRYLYLFEMAPRTFGQVWGERHLMEHIPEFLKPNTQRDSNYHGQYDLWLQPNIRVEVKASRVVDDSSDAALIEKALSSKSLKNFDMNFQQLKPSCCDVFVWMAVWLDKIDYWVIPSSSIRSCELRETIENPNDYLFMSNQHGGSRRTETGEVVEGQIHINRGNYQDFNKYKVDLKDVYPTIQKIFGKA